MNLHVYSIRCAWHGPIANVGFLKTPELRGGNRHDSSRLGSQGLPCCPHCQSVLMQMDEDEFWKQAEHYEKKKGLTNYVALMRWIQEQPTCYGSLEKAKAAFKAATGKEVTP